jgi:glycosyltransferase involved in cell wall biosynthesis
MIKALIVQNYIPYYRIPVYNAIVRTYSIDLTVLHSGKAVAENNQLQFKEIITDVKKFKQLNYQQGIIKHIKQNKYDVIIAIFDPLYINTVLLYYYNHYFGKTKFIWWGIGNGRNEFLNSFRTKIIKHADALLLYDMYYDRFYKNFKKKIFSSRNTIEVKQPYKPQPTDVKDSFLFVGTLYADKIIEELLNAILILKEKDFTCFIVGKGERKSFIESFIATNNLQHKVFLTGELKNEQDLLPYYKRAYASISPGQAGLSILQSFALGCPFVTREDAYTGGERFNIKNGETGFLYKAGSENLANIMQQYLDDKTLSYQQGLKAYNYYINNRTVDRMAESFQDVISYVLNDKKEFN